MMEIAGIRSTLEEQADSDLTLAVSKLLLGEVEDGMWIKVGRQVSFEVRRLMQGGMWSRH